MLSLIVLWDSNKIRRFMRWLDKQEGLGTDEIFHTNSMVFSKMRQEPMLNLIVFWDSNKIRRFMRWLDKQEGLSTDEIVSNVAEVLVSEERLIWKNLKRTWQFR
ncbi:uncharacterized protein LOC127900401 [Citrus sinensis]|uniref:uncharacterized protein LOC127900401 n=1 Tax=Citrus sinensis TaxID=2711 RepID=UPI0022775723|nr:uncharacterized protein LOC127900401 [Citrus sinensis]